MGCTSSSVGCSSDDVQLQSIPSASSERKTKLASSCGLENHVFDKSDTRPSMAHKRTSEMERKIDAIHQVKGHNKKRQAVTSPVIQHKNMQLDSISENRSVCPVKLKKTNGSLTPVENNPIRLFDDDTSSISSLKGHDNLALNQHDTPGHFSINTNDSKFSQTTFCVQRRSLVPSEDMFKEADERALKATPTLKDNPEQLVKYLVEPFSSKLLQFRAIWRWITHNIQYDVELYFHQEKIKSPTHLSSTNDILQTGLAVCCGYSQLLKMLSEFCNIRIHEVSGWSKGYDYVIGANFASPVTNHAWNAVELDCEWWLVDATWASGYVDDSRKFVPAYNEHYFLTDPRQFIIDHFPQHAKWQLIHPPFSIEDFESWAQFTKCFFHLRLRPWSHKEGTIRTNGKLHMKFRIDANIPVTVKGTLTCLASGSVSDNYLHIYSTNKTLNVLVNFPDAGEYELRLYGSRNEATNPIVDPEKAERDYSMLCMYKIVSNRKKERVSNEIMTFPRQFKKWTKGFYLHEPQAGYLIAGETYKFRFTLPGVRDIAICAGGKSSSLWIKISTAENGDTWCGELTMDLDTLHCTLVARFKHQPDNAPYSSVLEYQVGPAIQDIEDEKIMQE